VGNLRDFGPTATLDRAAEEVEAAKRHLAAVEMKFDSVIHRIALQDAEGDEAMTTRLRAYRGKQGARQARFRLSGHLTRKLASKSHKAVTLSKTALQEALPTKVYGFILQEWKRSKTGFRGVELGVKAMAERFSVTKRQLLRVLDLLNDELKLVVRLKSPGGKTRYAVSLPESDAYLATLGRAMETRMERLLDFDSEDALDYEEAA
jgi:hypothetical protein